MLLLLALLAPASSTSGAAPATGSSADRPEVSLHPTLQVTGGTPAQRDRLRLAVERFRDAGLPLPDLAVVFTGPNGCDGHLGRFVAAPPRWTVTFCSELDFLYEHELAHAWERANVDEATRVAFTQQQGLAVWSDERYEWRELAVEAAAFVVQQALTGPKLPLVWSEEHRRRVEGYSLLTGRPYPRRDVT